MYLTKMTAIVLIVLAAVGISACNDDDKDNDVVTSCTVTSCYTMMTDRIAGGVAVPSADISFVIEQNWTTATANIRISGLRTPDGLSFPSFTLVDCPWTVDSDGWMIFSTQTPTVESNASSAVPVLDSFEFEMLSRTVGQAFAPGISFSFGINSAYLVQGSRSPFFLIGETISTHDGGKSFTSYSPAYNVAIDNASLTATINIIGAQFADGMPSLNMEFSGIKATFCDDGSYLLSCDDLIPTISDTPYPNYPISDLRATLEPDDGMELTFVCTVHGTPFTVSADVTYLHQRAMEVLDAQ